MTENLARLMDNAERLMARYLKLESEPSVSALNAALAIG